MLQSQNWIQFTRQVRHSWCVCGHPAHFPHLSSFVPFTCHLRGPDLNLPLLHLRRLIHGERLIGKEASSDLLGSGCLTVVLSTVTLEVQELKCGLCGGAGTPQRASNEGGFLAAPEATNITWWHPFGSLPFAKSKDRSLVWLYNCIQFRLSIFF